MAEALSYAAAIPWYRKRRWLPLLTIPILILGYTLALPQFRTLRQHQIRRTEIRQQFKTQLENARQTLDAGELDSAAVALLNAEFPIRTEQHMFWSSEVETCRKLLKPPRARLLELLAIARAEEERREPETQARLEQERKEQERQGIYVTRCSFPHDQIVIQLTTGAAQQLRKGNNKNALAICAQLVQLDPGYEFDDQFWTKALPSP